MPYAAKKGDGENWDVINTETEQVRATHTPPDAEEKANRQVRLLNEIDSDPAWDAEKED